MRPVDRRVSSYVAAMPGGPRAAAAIALAIAVACVGVLLLLGRGSGGESRLVLTADDLPFYMEATVVVFSPPEGAAERSLEADSSVQWWYIRPSFWRWQIDTETTAEEEPQRLVGVADGRYAWVHDETTATYTRVSVKDGPSALLPGDVLLGPVDTAALSDRWQAQGVSVRSGGSGTYLGRATQVLEYSPTWSTGSGAAERSGGIGRLWVDAESGLVLRHVVDGGVANQYIDARVTLLELQPRVDRALFRFIVPEGSTRVDAP
jgi:outer membrane lipoprotein-sorting protein